MFRSWFHILFYDEDDHFSVPQLIVLFVVLIGWASLIWAGMSGLQVLSEPFPGFVTEPNGVINPFSSIWSDFEGMPKLAEPQKVIMVDDHPVNSARDLRCVLRDNYEIGESPYFTFVEPVQHDPDNLHQEVYQITLRKWPNKDIVFIFLFPYITSLLLAGLGTWVFISQRNAAGRVFVLSALLFALSLGLIFESMTSSVLPRVWIAAMAMIGVSFVRLAFLFPQPIRLSPRRLWGLYAPYILGIGLLIYAELTLYHWPNSWAFITSWRVVYAAGIGGMMFFLAMMVYRLRQPSSWTIRQQSRIILMGATLAFTPTIFWLASNVLGYPRPFVGIYVPFLAIYPIALSYTILRYHLRNIDAMFATGLAYVLLLGASYVIYLALRYLVVDALHLVGSPEDLYFILAFILVSIVAFPFLDKGIHWFVDWVFLRSRVDYWVGLQSFSHELAKTLSLSQIFQAIGTQLKELNISKASAWLFNEEKQCYELQSLGLKDFEPEVFLLDSLPVQRIAKQTSAFLLEPSRYPVDYALTKLGGAVCLPFKRGKKFIGWILLGARDSGEHYTADDLEFLTALADQSVLALENAILFENRRQQLLDMQEIKRLLDDTFASITTGVITINIHGQITLFTPVAERILGIPASEALKQPFTKVLTPLQDYLQRVIPEVLQSGKAISVETNPIFPNKGLLTLSLRITPLYSGSGVSNGVILLIDDITEHKQLESRATQIMETFENYFSSHTIEKLLENPDTVRWDGSLQEITVMIADLRQFTRFMMQTPPEYLVETLNLYLSLFADSVMNEDGLLDHFSGDSGIAFFNMPLVQEDHTMRAVRAALRLQRAVESYHQTVHPPHPLYFGIGIHTGTAVVGNIGASHRSNYTAIGLSIDITRHLQALARSGQILITDAVYQRVAKRVDVVSAGMMSVKGLTTPVKIYELRGLRMTQE